MVETTSTDSTAYRALYTNAISRGRSIHNFRLPELRRRFEDHRRPFDTLLRTGIEDPPVIIKILSRLGLPTALPAAASYNSGFFIKQKGN
jgi:hypothetical protein